MKRSVEHLELQELLCRLCDGQLAEKDRKRLVELLEDPAAREFYVDYLHLDACLRWDYAEPQHDEPTRKPNLPVGREKNPRSGGLELLGNVFQSGWAFLSKANVFGLLVALGLPTCLLVLLVLGVMRQSPPEGPVATIVKCHQCTGQLMGDRQRPLLVGMDVHAGQHIELTDGLAKLKFNDGAVAIVESPAVFEVRSSNMGFLRRGRLAATVPKQAQGFTIATPSATIVDLGTEFGVAVADDGTAEAHVFKGEVEVAPKATPHHAPAPAKRLTAGQAVEVLAGQGNRVVSIASRPAQFTRQLLSDLPKPTILFAHYGDTDPTTEGWTLSGNADHDYAKVGIKMGPVVENGTAAWYFRGQQNNQYVYFIIRDRLTPELMAEARQKGWVLRVRLWLNEKNPRLEGHRRGLCLVGYAGWSLWPLLDSSGDQYAYFCAKDRKFGPFVGTRNQYVDYEYRFDPATNQVEVYVDGRHVATRPRVPLDQNDEENTNHSLRFGMWRVASDVRFAKVEWGILRSSPNVDGGN